MADRLSVKDFAGKIKAKYPEYSEIEDRDLVSKIVAKYPEYEESIDFANWNKYGLVNAAEKQDKQRQPQQDNGGSYKPLAPLQQSVPKATDNIPAFKPYEEQTPLTPQDAERLRMGEVQLNNTIPKENVQLDLNTYDNKKFNVQNDEIDLTASYNKADMGEVASTELGKDEKYINQININRLREENLAEIQRRKELQEELSFE